MFDQVYGEIEKVKVEIQNNNSDHQKRLNKEKVRFNTLKTRSQEHILLLTKRNKALSEENVRIKTELQRCRDGLKLKELECQKLLNDKDCFQQKLKQLFFNDVSENNDTGAIAHSDFKRPHENDELASIDEETKRQKTDEIIPLTNSSGPNDDLINDLTYEDIGELVLDCLPGDDPLATDSNDDSKNDMDYELKRESVEEIQLDDNLSTTNDYDNVEWLSPSPSPRSEDSLVVSAVEVTQEVENPIQEKRRNFRKNIKRIMEFDSLTPETKLAYQQERERNKRYVQRLQRYNETYGSLPGEINKLDKLLLDVDFNTKRELLAVDKRLSAKLKPHQCQGVQFMFNACFESIEKLQSSEGSGCILGHCMGLGKTLQVIALIHTLLTHSTQTKVKKVLIICPVNVILNWVDEFHNWLKEFQKKESIRVYEFSSCQSDKRIKRIESWQKNGGVFIIGYRMFQSTQTTDGFHEAFINPGADLVVCDEGHLLKNQTTRLSSAMKEIRTLRRIILTGTPLQNNLKEYFTMVEFVKPRLLGTELEFNNRFVGPITNGQFIDSTEEDIMLMKYRAFILHKLLEGCVQRRDYSVLAEFLPPKQEYVLFIRLSKVQIHLYKYYMKNIVNTCPVADLPHLRKIYNHPRVLTESENRRKRDELKAQKNVDKTGNDDSIDNEPETAGNVDENDWWKSIYSGDKLELTSKILILFSIIAECEALGEKLLLFSGCLSTLNVIERFLKTITEKTLTASSSSTSTELKGVWTRDVDYCRLDGTSSIEKRRRDITVFQSNPRARLFLISTKAGGLGINLMSANRVVIFDASWNPSDDIQSIFRTYRIGQEKECFVYRFIALGTMEEKIYDRQVSKLSIAKRVIDEHQVNRHYKEEDLQELYSVKNLHPPMKHKRLNRSKDGLLNILLQKHRNVIFKYHDHDSLLENVKAETLSDQEIGDVWDEFEISGNDG